MDLYFLEYSDSKGTTWEIEAVCSTKQSANEMLHCWYDSECSIYEKYLNISSSITINEQKPEQSFAELVCKELKQWKEMRIVRRESDEWIWLKPEPKATKVEESYYFE